MKRITDFFKTLLIAVYPNKCICCGELIDEGNYLCNKCDNLIERNNLNDICLNCGFERKSCVCKFNIYRFNSLLCIFKNDGLARKAYYSYKFGKKQHYVKFFVNQLSDGIKQCYGDIDFDFICSVPSAKRFCYDHSGYIAKGISDVLKIPYVNDLLFCVKKTKRQHRSSVKERMTNVEGKYGYNYKINDANVLLIDDIKTTGATIDECAKMLLFAGANNVYCATVLGSVAQNKD